MSDVDTLFFTNIFHLLLRRKCESIYPLKILKSHSNYTTHLSNISAKVDSNI